MSRDEFLVGVRGQLNERRRALVRLAFKAIDADGNGMLELSDIVAKYDASKHPDVLSGKATKGQVMRAFLDTFTCGDAADGVVSFWCMRALRCVVCVCVVVVVAAAAAAPAAGPTLLCALPASVA